MKTITVGRLLLSRTLALNCQIACVLVVIFLLADHASASEISSIPIPGEVVLHLSGTENYLR